jgi:hypothetical protein
MCSGSRCIPAPRHPFASGVTGSGTEMSCLSHRITRSLTWADGALTARSKEAKKKKEKTIPALLIPHREGEHGPPPLLAISISRHRFFLSGNLSENVRKKISSLSLQPPLYCAAIINNTYLYNVYLCTLFCMHAINSPWRARLGKGKNENSSSCVLCCLCNCGRMYCGRGGRGSPTNY